MVLTMNVMESMLLPHNQPPRDLVTVVHALLLASILDRSQGQNQGSAARVLRKLGAAFDDPAVLAQLGQQLEAAQARRGAAAPRLPSAQELQQLWLRMCVRVYNHTPEAEGWLDIQQGASVAARRLTELDSANPRAWLELAGIRNSMLQEQEASMHASGIVTPGYRQQYTKKVTTVYRRCLAAARTANNRYHIAHCAYNLALDAARLKWGCPPAEAAALLRVAEAAWAAVKKLLPEEWATELRRERAAALAFQELLEAHARESPQAGRCSLLAAGGAVRRCCGEASVASMASGAHAMPPPDAACWRLQAWSDAIFDRMIGNLQTRFNSAERHRMLDPAMHTCDACGQLSLATRLCAACGTARYCRWAGSRGVWRERYGPHWAASQGLQGPAECLRKAAEPLTARPSPMPRYHSRECQKSDWRSHKQACQAAQATRASGSSAPRAP